MKNWKELKIKNITIEKVVGFFEVWAVNKVPSGKFKVKIIERADGSFIGVANLRVKSQLDGSPEGEAGLGKSICEALKDVIERLLTAINERKNLTDDDFEWAAHEDF